MRPIIDRNERRATNRRWLIPLLTLLLSGCVALDFEVTRGETGALTFAFPHSSGRTLDLSHPIALNQLAEIQIRSLGGHELPSSLLVEVDAPDVASCQSRYRLSDEIRIACRGLKPGESELRVRSSDGTLLDRATLRVAPTNRIAVTIYRDSSADKTEAQPGQAIVLGPSEQLSVVVTPFDPTDVELIAVNAVQVNPSATDVVTIERDVWSASNRLLVRGLKSGTQTLELSIDDRSFSLDVKVL